MKYFLILIAFILGTTSAMAETRVMCNPVSASVHVNGNTDMHQANILLQQAKNAGEFRARFEYSPEFVTVQNAQEPHHKWIGINDNNENIQYVAIMDFVTMTYIRTAYSKSWNNDGFRANSTHTLVSSCLKRQ